MVRPTLYMYYHKGVWTCVGVYVCVLVGQLTL
jgi:hypothetical protein